MIDYDRKLDVTLAQVQGLQTEIQLTKRKVLLELYVSSFAAILFALTILWFILQTSLYKFAVLRVTPTLLMLPLMVNASMWMVWVIYSGNLRNPVSWSDARGYPDDDDVRSLYREYEWLRYSLFRSKRIERMLDLLTALEFVTLTMILGIIILQVTRFM